MMEEHRAELEASKRVEEAFSMLRLQLAGRRGGGEAHGRAGGKQEHNTIELWTAKKEGSVAPCNSSISYCYASMFHILIMFDPSLILSANI